MAHPIPGTRLQGLPQHLIAPETRHGSGEGLRVPWRHKKARHPVANGLANGPRRGAYHRQTRRHCLENHVGHAVPIPVRGRNGRNHQNIRCVVILKYLIMTYEAHRSNTLLQSRLPHGLLYPSEGRISIGGFDTRAHNLKARQKAAFVLNEERSFYWRLTGLQNLQFFGALDNIPPKLLHQRAEALLHAIGLDGAARKRVSDYSSGMKQRLAIARALLSEPDVLLLDEPTRSLDPLATRELRRSIRERLNESEGRTLILVTHSLGDVEDLCRKVCVIAQGRLVALDDVHAVLSRPGGLASSYEQAIQSVD